MKNTTITPTIALALIGVSPAGISHLGLGDHGEDDVSVATMSPEPSLGRKILSTPVRALGVNDDLPPMLAEGTQEFGLSGNVNFADDLAYNLNLSYGWFVKDQWQVGFNAGVQGVESDYNFSLGLFTEYNFAIRDSKWVPFIGFSANWAELDSDAFDASSIALGLDLGVKYFIRENVALSFSIGADYAFDDVFPGGDDFAEQINIGTRFYF